jgi:stress-induced morphogen
MPMDARDIESMIKAAIPDAEVTIRDLAGDGDHYAATVISESFRGKSRVQQHQIVYQSLKGQMGGVLHALALQTGVPGDPGYLRTGGTWRTRGEGAIAQSREQGTRWRATRTRRAVSPIRAAPAQPRHLR